MNTLFKRTLPGTILVLFCYMHFSVQAQPTDTLQLKKQYKKQFNSVLRANRTLSYFTPGRGIGNLEPLIFEASVATNYFISSKRGMWALQLSPRILLRMRNEKSYPVVNPSYMLPLAFHQRLRFWRNTRIGSLLYPESYITLGFQHHSNGQSGPFFLKNGSINREKGSFATNFFSLALTGYSTTKDSKGHAATSLQLQYERHVPGLSFEESQYPHALEGRYGLDRLFLKFNKFNLASRKRTSGTAFFKNSRLTAKSGWIFGGISYPASSELSKRLIFQLRYLYNPRWMRDIALFAGYYRGQDYYNIFFDRNLYIFRIGLMSDPFGNGQNGNAF